MTTVKSFARDPWKKVNVECFGVGGGGVLGERHHAGMRPRVCQDITSILTSKGGEADGNRESGSKGHE